MINAQEIVENLKKKWQAGDTQSSMAKKSGLSQPYLCDLISGKADIEGLTIRKLNRLFPECSLQLTGDITIKANNNSGSVVGVNNGEITMDCLAAVLDKILESEELSDGEKVKVMKVLKK